MSKPVFRVDFNELVAPDRVLLSKGDEREAQDGQIVAITEGMPVRIWDEDLDEHGNRDDLIADGVAVRNQAADWSQHVRWCCQIDSFGIRHQSDIDTQKRTS